MNFLCKPYLLTLNPSSEMNIVWIQKTKTSGFVEYGENDCLQNRVQAECHEIKGLRAPLPSGEYGKNPHDHEEVSVWQYIAKIEKLAPGQRVYYRCCNDLENTKIYDFHTAPENGDYRFAQLCDLQGLAGCEETVYKAGLTHPDFLLYSGDATFNGWRLDSWFDTEEPWQEEGSRKRAFFPCMQQEDGARLMQYAPLFFCPGNHEVDDIRCYADIELMVDESNWTWSIFMQMFRPLYTDTDTSVSGRRWYSVNYADMHIVSLSINRFCGWYSYLSPGWKIYDSIAPDSPQINWLREDLNTNKRKFTWVIQHFHILNKGKDVQHNLCDPEIDADGNVTYPHDHGGELMDLYSANGVNAVTFGHSHVYERYYRKSVHYIEAAYISHTCYRKEEAKPHPSGLLPVVENLSGRSYLIVDRKKGGLFANGYFTDGDSTPFDSYQIADETGASVPPQIS